MTLADRTIAALAGDIGRAGVTSERITEACLQRIVDLNPRLNAFITVLADAALAAARQADHEIAAGRRRGALHGIPLSLKDLLDLAGTATTAGSRVRADHRATRDAVVTAHLKEAGAVIVGKTNLHEFAFGTTTEDSAFGPARHPLDDTRSPGGSSGGSAIAVRTGMCIGTVGTDTGGSIRIPAAACGIVGLKPAWGEVSDDGVVPLSAQLDHVGPLARSVTDAWLLYESMLGRHQAPGARLEAAPASTLRLGLPRTYYMARLDPEVGRVLEAALATLRKAGVAIDDVPLPSAGDIAPVYLHLVLSDAAAYHADTLERRPGDYTPNVRHRLELGRYVLAEDYVRALRGRAVLRAEVNRALDGRHALVLPALGIPAPPLGAATVDVEGGPEPVRNLMLRCTQLFNLTSHPAITIPCGATSSGLPVGLQLAGPPTRDLLAIAHGVEALFAHA
ncbi:MAG: amidase [Acidobacteriota bacterium]